MPRAGVDSVIPAVDQIYLDKIMKEKRKQRLRKKRLVAKSMGKVQGSQQRRDAGLLFDEAPPKPLKPMRATISSSELMLDQIKKLAYSQADTFNYWLKSIEESDELLK